jgi:hypothetical protein
MTADEQADIMALVQLNMSVEQQLEQEQQQQQQGSSKKGSSKKAAAMEQVRQQLWLAYAEHGACEAASSEASPC